MISPLTILAVFGILATIVLGVWSICIMAKRKYQGQVTFIRESCLGLFDSIVKNMPELAVQYKGNPVSQGLVLLKGSFLNTGAKDISDVMVEEEIAISLPDEFKWLTAKIVSSSTKVKSNVKVSEKAIKFNTGLFRCKEYIRFEALAEMPAADSPERKEEESIEKNLIDSLNITHRIADTQKIKMKELPQPDYTRKLFKKHLVQMAGPFLAGISIFVILCFTGLPGNLHFVVPVESGDTVEVKIKARYDGTLKIKGVDDRSYRKILSPESFFKTPNIIPKVVPDKFFRFLIIFLIFLYVVYILFFLGIVYREQKQTKKLRQLLEISE